MFSKIKKFFKKRSNALEDGQTGTFGTLNVVFSKLDDTIKDSRSKFQFSLDFLIVPFVVCDDDNVIEVANKSFSSLYNEHPKFTVTKNMDEYVTNFSLVEFKYCPKFRCDYACIDIDNSTYYVLRNIQLNKRAFLFLLEDMEFNC